MPIVISALCLAVGMVVAVSPAYAETLRKCQPEDQPPYYDAPWDEVAAHREFEPPRLSYPFGTRQRGAWGFNLRLVVDAEGKPVCLDAASLVDVKSSSRKALLTQMATWRYAPFMHDGAAAPMAVTQYVYEEELPARHVPAPDGDARDAVISLTRTPCFGFCPGYTVTLHGDGHVVYDGQSYVSVTGEHAYQVPAEDVTRLVDLARKSDLWSMRDAYVANMTDGPSFTLSVTIGGKTKTIHDYVGAFVGMPKAVADLEALVDRTAHTQAWIGLTEETLERLKAEGFDFTSQAGADLLARAVDDRQVTDEAAMLALIAAGAPLRGGRTYTFAPQDGREIDLLESALTNGREQLVEALLARDVLTTDGAPDQVRIDRAFHAAIDHGRMKDVMAIWAYHPGLTYVDTQGYLGSDPKTTPVTLLLQTGPGDKDWQGFEIARFLIDQGCDVRASNAKGETLLHIAAGGSDVAFVDYLIAKGADIRARDGLGGEPLNGAFNEDVAIALLEAGADPLYKPSYTDSYAVLAERYGMARVVAWLTAHGIKAR